MPFSNRIRLPIYTQTPQFPTEANRFRLANGESKTLSVTVRKTYTVLTDYMGELMHQMLVIALNHDDVTIEGDKYIGGVTVDGEYAIEWPDFIDYPLGQAKVLVQVTPFDATNTNCQSCDVLAQLSLVDDDIGELNEGAEGTMNVYTNDSICCFPVTAEVISFASGYLDSATINQATGIITLTVKNPVATVGSIILATYKVTCPDGTYDTADVYGSVSGSEDECEQPADFFPFFLPDAPAPFTITINWATPAIVPSGGYEWVLYEAGDLGTPIDSGTVMANSVTFDAPEPSTDYILFIRSVCGEGIYSPYSEKPFTTPGNETDDCGSFNVIINDGTPDDHAGYVYSYMNCNGDIVNKFGRNLNIYTHCMLMDAFNQPVFFESDDDVFSISYVEPC